MELGFLNADHTAYTCNMFDKKKKKVMLLLVLPCAPELQSRTLQC